MRRSLLSLVLLCAVLAIWVEAQAPQKLTKADFEKMMKELSNWGRWGKSDQAGTVNLITPAKRKAAAALVTEGYSVSLSRDTDTQQEVDNTSPFIHKMNPGVDNEFNMDEYSIAFHGFAHTHMDSLSHVFYKGRMYNGFPQSSVKSSGAEFLAVTAYREGIFTRGVLVDIPWLRHVRYLEATDLIYPEELDAWEKKTGVHIQSGDAVFIRTGRWALRAAKGPWDIAAHSAGLYASSARWFKQRDIAILGGDTSNDVLPSRIDGVTFPLHELLLVAMGTPMFDQCDLEPLAKAAAARNRWTFLLTAAPLRATGGTGSPLNPIATF